MNKIIQWVLLNGASMIAFVQVIVKFVKEVLTAVVNILFPIIPDGAFEAVVLKVRDFVNMVDGWLETIKSKLIK